MNKLYLATVTAVISLVFLIVIGVSQWRDHTAAAAAAAAAANPCSNPPSGTLCANDQWYGEWRDLQSLSAEIARDQHAPAVEALQEKMDRALGLQTRLQQMIPHGYNWDPSRKLFVPAPAPIAATPSATPAAPAPSK